MTYYTYPIEWQDEWELQYVAGKIYYALDTSPADGLFTGSMMLSDGQISVEFNRDLTPAELLLVDNVMSQPDVGAWPNLTGMVVIDFPDFLHDWKALETAIGIDVAFAAINPRTGHVYLVLADVPNTSKKNSFFAKLRAMVTISKDGTPV